MDHFYQSIPGWAAFAPLYFQVAANARDGQKFVEVGSWLGRSAALMAVELMRQNKRVEFVCVDPWLDGGPDLRDTKHFKDLGVSQVYDMFLRNMRPVISRVKVMRMTSVQAAGFMPDKSVDFLMLDGDHGYEAVAADIRAWMPKMAPGALISGDDYTWPGVERAVGEAFEASRVQTSINKGKRRNADYRKDSSYWWVQL